MARDKALVSSGVRPKSSAILAVERDIDTDSSPSSAEEWIPQTKINIVGIIRNQSSVNLNAESVPKWSER